MIGGCHCYPRDLGREPVCAHRECAAEAPPGTKVLVREPRAPPPCHPQHNSDSKSGRVERSGLSRDTAPGAAAREGVGRVAEDAQETYLPRPACWSLSGRDQLRHGEQVVGMSRVPGWLRRAAGGAGPGQRRRRTGAGPCRGATLGSDTR